MAIGKPETPIYSASKAAIVSLTRGNAINYTKDQIRVNCGCPGVIETPMMANVPEDDPAVQAAVKKRKRAPQEAADAVLPLSSPRLPSFKVLHCQLMGAILLLKCSNKWQRHNNKLYWGIKFLYRN
ncbi:unnamed protein product [Fusarium fujikuroi]|uniref:Uncharacterized protein n=1 Tax=Fusarium fujikuroi TaxID=5127 RepID=A0A9Q9U4W3_FUSFU|nr:unnamed protein product [Fusarium fujikuroi]VTT57241.1 unnamed protein product [Fusarium fujikuroi]VZI09325.1 unnamed protein product [Fusarium fujikuroi]